MKWPVSIFLCALFALTLSSCFDSRPVLKVYTWTDYLNPELVPKFEKEAGCRVEFIYFESNEEMEAKMKAGEGEDYDLIVPSSYALQELHHNGFLGELDHAKIPNIEHVDRDFLKDQSFDPEMKYNVPYMSGFTGLAYTSGMVDENISPTWALLSRPYLKNKTILLDGMRETIGVALKFNGFSLNSTNPDELATAKETLKEWSANAIGFESDDYDSLLAQNDIRLTMAYSGDVLAKMEDNKSVRFVAPREGMEIFTDNLVLNKTSPQPDLAHAFINFLHEPANCAANAEYIMYRCPNTAAYELLSEEFRNHPAVYPSAEVMANCEMMRDIGEAEALYEEIWKEVRGDQGLEPQPKAP